MKTEGVEHERVGSLAGGYNRLARDFDRALHLARLSAVQLFLIQQAREQSWTRAQIDGAPESYPFRLNLSDATRLVAAARSGVRVQHARLVAARIFLDLGDGRFLINKDYRTWIDPDGRTLLSPVQLRWCLEVRRKKKKGGHPSGQGGGHSSGQGGLNEVATPVARPENSSGHPLATPVASPENSSGQSGLSGMATPVASPDPSPRTPIYEARTPAPAPAPAQRVSEERRRDPEEIPPSGGGGGDDGSGSEEPFHSGPGSDPTPRNDPAAVEDLLRWVAGRVARAYPRDESALEVAESYARTWYVHEKYTRAEIHHAVELALAEPKQVTSFINYARRVLQTERGKAGRPAAARADAPHAGPAPLSRAQAHRQSQADAWRAEAQRRMEADRGED